MRRNSSQSPYSPETWCSSWERVISGRSRKISSPVCSGEAVGLHEADGVSSVPSVATSTHAELARRLSPSVRFNEPMARHTSLRVGGPADMFFVARTTDQLIHAIEQAAELTVPWTVIGSASNLVVADDGIEGFVVKVVASDVREHAPTAGSETLVEADAGCILARLARQTALQGLAGLEWAVNVPGTVGAAVVNNSGAFGSCTAEHIVDVSVYLPFQGMRRLSATDIGHDYRTSRLKRRELNAVVLSATYRLVPGDREQLRGRIGELQRLRRSTQPSGFSVGSVFANPIGDAAGRLIEACGLKGFRIGDAEVARLHANFILNRGSARARDVTELMRHVQVAVWQHARRWLAPEVQLVGRWHRDEIDALLLPPGDLT
ncbi:MAG: UDP-N-acetylmuramate dehydrogenase [Chloroflexi bacterium]|nr:UDP-N-acetylmuramate dehydrogenase [Chloroflexota bacterium]